MMTAGGGNSFFLAITADERLQAAFISSRAIQGKIVP